MLKKELLIILILAVLVTISTSYIRGAPFRFLEVVFCIQMIGAGCPPYRIIWSKLIVDFLFWLLVLTGGWLILKFVLKKIRMKK